MIVKKSMKINKKSTCNQNKILTRQFKKQDFISSGIHYELMGDYFLNFSIVKAKSYYIKAIICNLAGKKSKKEVLDLCDKLSSKCITIISYKELKIIDILMDSIYNKDIDRLADCIEKLKISL